MNEWHSGYVKANGINIHYHRTGEAKPALLLLHGITDNGLCWTRFARDLEQRYDIIMPDARGHGSSEGVSSGFTEVILAQDAAGVITALGHVLGGDQPHFSRLPAAGRKAISFRTSPNRPYPTHHPPGGRTGWRC